MNCSELNCSELQTTVLWKSISVLDPGYSRLPVLATLFAFWCGGVPKAPGPASSRNLSAVMGAFKAETVLYVVLRVYYVSTSAAFLAVAGTSTVARPYRAYCSSTGTGTGSGTAFRGASHHQKIEFRNRFKGSVTNITLACRTQVTPSHIPSHPITSHHSSSRNPYTQLPIPTPHQKIQPKQKQMSLFCCEMNRNALHHSWFSGPRCITSATQPEDIAMRCACACGCVAWPSSPTSICAYFPALRNKGKKSHKKE
jgi:hypothetical protein